MTLPNETAVQDGSAPSGQAASEEQQQQQAVADGSAPSQQQQEQPAAESTEVPGSEPEGELGEKGRKELIALRKRSQEAEQREAYWRGVAEGRQPAGEQPAAAAPVRPPDAPPNAADFEDYEEYLVAKAEYKIQQNNAKREAETHIKTLQSNYNQRFEKAKERYSDLQQQVDRYIKDPTIPKNVGILNAVLASENGVDIVYELATHPQEARRIGSMDPVLAAVEIGKMEARMSASSQNTQRISQAPEPVKVLGGGSVSVSTDLEKVPLDDFMKKRNAAQYGRK